MVAHSIVQKQRSRRDALHVVRTDVLLHALSGFGVATDLKTRYVGKHSCYTDHQIRELRKLAALQKSPYGAVKELASRLDLPWRSVLTAVYHLRRGTGPRVWREVA